MSRVYLSGAKLPGGIDVALNPFSFVSRVDGEDRTLLRLSEIRPAIEVGALLWP